MAGEPLGICCQIPLALWSCLPLHFLDRWQAHRRSVAILPSALVREPVGSVPVGRFSLQWVLPPVCRSLVVRLANQEPDLSRSHPNAAIWLGLHSSTAEPRLGGVSGRPGESFGAGHRLPRSPTAGATAPPAYVPPQPGSPGSAPPPGAAPPGPYRTCATALRTISSSLAPHSPAWSAS